MKHKVRINVDKLVCSFRCPEWIYQMIAHKSNGDIIHNDGFDFFITNAQEDEEGTTKILAKCILNNGVTLGSLRLNKNEYNGLAFFAFDNQALYNVDGYSDGKKMNYQFYLSWVAEHLGLAFNSITLLEIAVDANHNVQRRLKQLMRDDDFDVYINRRKRTDKKKVIEEAHAISPMNCYGLLPKHTMYFASAKKDVTLKLYDKEAEISKSGKKYIQDWNSMKKIWRTEVSVRWPKFKEWLSIINSSENYPDSWKRYINPNAGQPHQSQSEPQEEFIERVFLLLQDEQFLYATFDYFVDKLLYLKNKKEKWSVLDIAYSFD